jgi:hypothetical protein
MHNIAAAVESLADRLLANAGAEVERCQREVSEAQKRLDDLAAKLELAKTAVERRDHFEPRIGGHYQCPYCWINDGARASLTPIPDDMFRCEECDRTISDEV